MVGYGVVILDELASSYSHLILVSSCETLLPYYKLRVPPWVPSLLQSALRSSFPIRSSLVQVGGHTSFAMPVSIRSFIGMLSYSYSVLSILFVCSLLSILVLLSYLPILSVLPCLAFLLA